VTARGKKNAAVAETPEASSFVSGLALRMFHENTMVPRDA
jgi:hypothetical protein